MNTEGDERTGSSCAGSRREGRQKEEEQELGQLLARGGMTGDLENTTGMRTELIDRG